MSVLLSKLAGLGAAAKAAVAVTAVAATLGAAGGAVAVVGGTSDAAGVARGALQTDQPAPPVEAVAPATTTLPPTTAVAGTITSGPPTTKPAAAASRRGQPSAPATTVAAPSNAAATPAASAATPLVPTGVARRTPSAAEVQQALKTLPQYVKTIIKPTAAQVAELGDRVCTAFDEGQTFAQVKATGLELVTQVPRTTVLPGGADWVVRTIVALYCPGHAPKLV